MTAVSLGTLWRTLRPLRARQVAALLADRLRGRVRPQRWRGAPPELALREPATGFLGAPEHARFDGWRRFELLEREVHFADRVDWDFAGHGPLWAYHLHQFDYLRRPALDPRARSELLLDWIARHRSGIGWSPHPTGLRILCWLKLRLTPNALALAPREEAQLRASLASQAATLSRHLERHLLANHYLSNLIAVVAAGVAFAGGAAAGWLAHERELRAELREQILADGAHFERSPMYHALLLESLLDLVNLSAVRPRAELPAGLEEELREVTARMLGALRVWTHPDGRIALFGDSALGIAHEPAELEDYALRLGIQAKPPPEEGVLREAGFVRLEAGPFSLLASVAGPMPPYQPGHAHADALAFELAVGRERVVTDTGVSEYIPGALREASRATRSHATLEVGGRDQAELWAAHRVGGRPEVALVRVVPGRELEATCAGWATPRTRHRRRIRVTPEAVELADRIEGEPASVRATLPLAPGLEPQLDGHRRRAWIALRRAGRLELELPEGLRWSVEPLPYFPRFGARVERLALVGRAAVPPRDARLRIRLEPA